VEAHNGQADRPAGPLAAVYAFASDLSSGRPAAAAARFTRDSCLITPDGTSVHGRDLIRKLLEQLTARRTVIETDLLAIHAAGNVARASGLWRLTLDGPEGSRFVQACNPTVVLHRIESSWRLAIVAPWG
jgi:ketosteroid isomerase-like protein